jgi:hypothetical protein
MNTNTQTTEESAQYEKYYSEVSATWARENAELQAKAVSFLRASDELRSAVHAHGWSDRAVAPLIVAVWGQMWVAKRVIPGLLYYTRPYIDAVVAHPENDDWDWCEPYLTSPGIAFNQELFRKANGGLWAAASEDEIPAAIERGLKG